MSIQKLGLDSSEYKTHSFRIGAASNAWASGVSEHTIATQGRWKCKCLHNHIRIYCLVNIQNYLNKIATKGFIALSYTIIQS